MTHIVPPALLRLLTVSTTFLLFSVPGLLGGLNQITDKGIPQRALGCD